MVEFLIELIILLALLNGETTSHTVAGDLYADQQLSFKMWGKPCVHVARAGPYRTITIGGTIGFEGIWSSSFSLPAEPDSLDWTIFLAGPSDRDVALPCVSLRADGHALLDSDGDVIPVPCVTATAEAMVQSTHYMLWTVHITDHTWSRLRCDRDADDDVDLMDYADWLEHESLRRPIHTILELGACLHGPWGICALTPSACSSIGVSDACIPFDRDGDNDVDLADVQLFFASYKRDR